MYDKYHITRNHRVRGHRVGSELTPVLAWGLCRALGSARLETYFIEFCYAHAERCLLDSFYFYFFDVRVAGNWKCASGMRFEPQIYTIKNGRGTSWVTRRRVTSMTFFWRGWKKLLNRSTKPGGCPGSRSHFTSALKRYRLGVRICACQK